MPVFCYQCEQTAKGAGCTVRGVCGKDQQTAALQDVLVHALQGLSMYAHRGRELGVVDREADVFALKALFATLTNVNFDPERIAAMIRQACELRDRARVSYEQACAEGGRTPEELGGPALFAPADTLDGLAAQAEEASVLRRRESFGEDIAGLQDLLLYGVKGLAAYADHAQILGFDEDDVYAYVHEMLDYLTRGDHTVDELLARCLRCGEVNLKVMGMLDAAHTSAYGDPVPTEVRMEPVKGKAILVSGHDLKDLEELLKQTKGKGVNVYTHGEMLPAHGYPELKGYAHLVGNYGGAWQRQRQEFEQFPGAILMTTNCIQEPKDSYRHRIFTSGVVGWPGVQHIADRDFGPVIEAALAEEGFAEDGSDRTVTVGFGHSTVLSLAPKLMEAVQSGSIRHFFLIGGCDGAKPGRSYYTDFAKAVPEDCAILTLACGKYRINALPLGDIGGIPRLLDCGQCNDAYSAIKIAQGLAEAFKTDVNSLPLSLVLSWFEQKAVVILLTLLHLGIKDMRLGPSLPAFVTPPVLQVLVEKFDLKPISTPEEDLKAILG
jgi:hydroxylamine reductase